MTLKEHCVQTCRGGEGGCQAQGEDGDSIPNSDIALVLFSTFLSFHHGFDPHLLLLGKFGHNVLRDFILHPLRSLSFQI